MFRKTLIAAACAAAAFGMASSAQAGPTFSVPFSFDKVICDTGVGTCPGAFNITGSFARPAGGYHHASVSAYTTAVNPGTGMFSNGFNVNVNSASLNSTPLTLTSPDGGVTEYGFTTGTVPLLDFNTYSISGFTGGEGAIFGNITFSSPEPSAWALMLLGFGGVGMMVRRRKSQARPQLAAA